MDGDKKDDKVPEECQTKTEYVIVEVEKDTSDIEEDVVYNI